MESIIRKAVRTIALALVICATGGAWAADAPTITVSGTTVTINNETASTYADNSLGINSTWQSKGFWLPSGTGLDAGKVVKVTSIAFGVPSGKDFSNKIGIAGCVSASGVRTSSGFSTAGADKVLFSFADSDCYLRAGSSSQIWFLDSNGSKISSTIWFRTGANSNQYIDSLVWGGSAPVIEVVGEIMTGSSITGALTAIGNNGSNPLYAFGVTGWLDTENNKTGPVVLVENNSGAFSIGVNNANSVNASGRHSTWSKLSGSGSLGAVNGQSTGTTPVLEVYDASEFTGSIVTDNGGPRLSVVFGPSADCTSLRSSYNGWFTGSYLNSLYVTANGSVTIPAGKTWKASKLVVKGSAIINGTFNGEIVKLDGGTVTVNAGASVSGGFGPTRDFDGWTIDPSIPVKITMTAEEYGKGSVSVTGASGISTITVLDPYGTTVGNITPDGDGAGTYNRGSVLVSGKACWVDYEMNGNRTNAGTDTTDLQQDGYADSNAFYNNSTLYTYTHPFRNNLSAYPASWTAVVRCTVPNLANAAIITFGNQSAGLLGLIAGDDPETQMKLVQTTGNSAYATKATMDVLDATSAQHVYVFAVENSRTLKCWCDGSLVLNETLASPVSIGAGFQIGSVVYGVGSTGIVRWWPGDTVFDNLSEAVKAAAQIDCLRLYDYILSAEQIAALSDEFPAVKLYRATVEADAVTDWNSLTWKPGWDGGNAQSKIILTVEGNASITLPSTITAADFQIVVPDDNTLTLSKDSGGSTLTLTNPLEIDGGTVTFGSDLGFGVNAAGTGKIRLDNGFTVNSAISGTVPVEIPSAATVTVDGGSIGNPITGSGTISFGALPSSALSFSSWTGTVALPTITGGEITFNNYGVSGSKVQVAGMTGGYLSNAEILPEIYLAGNMTLPFFSASYANTINKLTGSGTFSLTADGSASDYGDGYFWIKDVSGFTGSISVDRPCIAIGGATKPTSADHGKIVLQGDATIPSGATWTAPNGVIAEGVTLGLGATLNSYSTPPVSGELVVNASTRFAFASGTMFPCSVATSISGSHRMEAANYTINGVPGTVPLALDPKGYLTIPETATYSGGDTKSLSALGLSTAYIESIICTIHVTGDGTIALGSTTAGSVTIDVPSAITLNLTGKLKADEITLTGGGSIVCQYGDTLQGTIKGASAVTISYPNHTLPSGAIWTDTDWQGTLVLNQCGHLATTPAGDRVRVPFETYGNTNSKIRAPGFKGIGAVPYADSAEAPYCAATLVIGPDDVFEFNHGDINTDKTHKYAEYETAGYRFAKLSGTGTLRLDGTTDFAQYIFTDVSGFEGTVEITYPAEGGRKSYIFGANGVLGSSVPANLVIDENESVTVAAGKTWDIPAGIIIDKGAVLSLSNNSTITVLSSRSESDATLKVVDGASATVTNIMGSVLKPKLDIGTDATLRITDTSLTKLTIPADSVSGTYINAGTLNLSGCTNLEKLYLVLGETNSKDFDTSKVTLASGTCGDIYYNIGTKRDLTGYTLPTFATGGATNICFYAEETDVEYENGGFVVSNVVSGADLWLIRQNGALIHADVSNETYRVYAGGRSFAGASCWHEWDFEQEETADKLNDSGACTKSGSDVPSVTLLKDAGEIAYGSVTIPTRGEDKATIPASVKPHAEIPFGTTWSAAVRCTMPTTPDQVAVAFGDTTNGMLGLASGENGFVDLFNWTSAGGYTPLAQFQVENSTSDMHIYVFVVDSGSVSLYRDGEFIHRAAFSLNGAITQFKVGDVCGNRGELEGLPTVATTGDVDYIRLYNKILPEADITGLSRRRPFISAIDAFDRTLGVADYWVEAGTWNWTKANGAGDAQAGEPTANANVTVGSEGVTNLKLNRESNIKYGTLIFTGIGTINIVQTGTGKIGAGMFVVRSGAKLVVDCGAVDFSDSTVGVDEDATLTFDLADFPFAEITTNSTITLINNVPEAGIESARARYAIAVPEELPANIASVNAGFVGNSYKLTINTTHQAGADVYYKSGDLIAGMTVYLVDTLTGDTSPMFASDKVNITDESDTGDVAVYASFDGDLVVSHTAVTITPTGEGAVLDGRTITVADDCTVTFTSGNYGNMILAKSGTGTGTFVFEGVVSVASLTGEVGITVADGATLTLASIDDFVTGGVEGTGTVVLPEIATGVNFNFDAYGNPTNTVALTSFTGTIDPTVATTLRLDGSVTITSEAKAYSFAKITGNSSITFTGATDPTSVTIAEVANTVSIFNDSDTEVTITVLSLPVDVAFGAKILTTTGNVVVSGVSVGGESSEIVPAYADDGVYKAVASYNDAGYKSFTDVIEAAGEAYGEVIVLDEASLPGDLMVSGNRLEKKSTDYTWVGGESTSWTTPGNWAFGDAESPSTASRSPDTMDRVIFTDDANIVLTANVSVGGILCGATLTFTGSGAVVTPEEAVILTAVGASITSRTELSVVTDVPYYTVNEATDGSGNQVYTLVKKPGTIFSVY